MRPHTPLWWDRVTEPVVLPADRDRGAAPEIPTKRNRDKVQRSMNRRLRVSQQDHVLLQQIEEPPPSIDAL